MAQKNETFKKIKNFLLVSTLGKGQFGHVYKAIDETNNLEYAVKILPKNEINKNKKLKELLDNEIKVMKICNHENIVNLIEFIESTNNYYIVMDYCNEGDLENMIKKRRYLSEVDAVNILQQLLNGFKRLHELEIMHRDFKAANIFIKDGSIKIGDFGFAKTAVVIANTILGTPLTMAPEVLEQKKYNNKADLWSLGVVYYQMIFGSMPFSANNEVQLLKKIKNEGASYKHPNIEISQESKDFLNDILIVDPVKRINWPQVYNHKLLMKYRADKTVMKTLYQRKNIDKQIEENINFYEKKKEDNYKDYEKDFYNIDKIGNNSPEKKNEIRKEVQEEDVVVNEDLQKKLKINESIKNNKTFFENLVKKMYHLIGFEQNYLTKQINESVKSKKNLFNLNNFEDFCLSIESVKILENVEDIYCSYLFMLEDIKEIVKVTIKNNKEKLDYIKNLEYEINVDDSNKFNGFYKEILTNVFFKENAKEDVKSKILSLMILDAILIEKLEIEDYNKYTQEILSMKGQNIVKLVEEKIDLLFA